MSDRMEIADVLRAYDVEVRAAPIAHAGLTVEDDGQVKRLVGTFNFVCSWRLAASEARATVEGLAARFRARGQGLMWRVHDHDEPREISAYLAENGFEPEPPGTLMFLDLETASTAGAQNIEVRRVTTEEELSNFLALADQAFGGESSAHLYEAYLARMRDPGFALFIAYDAGAPVASGRLESAGRFGQLYGGGVHPAYRGRGHYRALVLARAEHAKRQGLRYLSTEARDASRPILEKLGFVPAAREVTWVLPRTSA
jgi:GNAT superfamily N-acetyltransferase